MARILVVDDERNIRRTLRMVLEGEGHEIEEAADAEAGLEIAAGRRLDLALVDLRLPGLSGLEALARLRPDADAEAPDVVMISGQATLADAVQATRLGAFDFLEKPLDRERLLVTVRNALERRAMSRKLRDLRRELGAPPEMLGASAAMRELGAQIARVAATRARVLVLGESGTGKELAARAIHRMGALATGPFIKVNCAAIAPEIIESELFGHERGAFTGAVGRHRGLFESADGGTIFLDEIGDMSLAAQAKVLRVLQTGELQRVGGERNVRVDVRVIAATNKDLAREVATDRFREDLYFRLAVVVLTCPPLRERREDISLLVGAFVGQACREHGMRPKRVTPAAVAALAAHDWPGNVRELRNVIERAVIFSDEEIDEPHVAPSLARRPGERSASSPGRWAGLTLRDFRERTEREFLRTRLEEHGWNVSRTAEALGIERTHLHRKLRQYGMSRDDEEE